MNPALFPDVSFGAGVVAYPGTRIAAGAQIGHYCILAAPASEFHDPAQETVLAERLSLGPYSIVHAGARIGAESQIAPFSTIGAESVLGRRCRVIYGAQIHAGVNVGERAVVGGFSCERAFIGDGAIMLGQLIHRLDHPEADWDSICEPAPRVEAGAIVGFGALIIGPVTISTGARVAAGAIVTKNVGSAEIAVGTTVYLKRDWDGRKSGQ